LSVAIRDPQGSRANTEVNVVTTYSIPATTAVASTSTAGVVRFWLRAEGLAAFVAAVVAYGMLGGQWLFLIPLLLVPDVSAIGYVAGPRAGAFVYDLVHNWAIGTLVVALGVATGSTPFLLAGTILVGHVGMDRFAGYGLKYPTFFKDTHLQRV
jgi:Domain of unknown function (DUF4260)